MAATPYSAHLRRGEDMSYDLQTLAMLVDARLRHSPLVSMTSLAADMGVHRHTIGRAIKLRFGMTFATLREQYLAKAIEESLSGSPLKSIKVVAEQIGFGSATALARASRRVIGQAPTGIRRK